MDIPPNQEYASAPKSSQAPVDPHLAAYELLRRMICNRAPFDPLAPEQSAILDEFKDDIEFGVWAYQISLYLEAVRIKLGPPISERARAHLLLLSAFDEVLEERLTRFLGAVRTAGERYTDRRYADLHEDPAARYYFVLSVVFLIVSGCPEERQRPLIPSVMKLLVTARARAETVFGRELGDFRGVSDSLAPWRAPVAENIEASGSTSGISESFQWSTRPGPFERQLRRQQDNPLFPAAVRRVDADQVIESRTSDLRLMSDFMSTYRPMKREVLSTDVKMVVKEASDLEKRMIDLIPPCVVLGGDFSSELKFLEDVSDSIDLQLARTTGETGLRDVYARVTALSRIQGRLLSFAKGLPTGKVAEDFPLRSLLSGSPDMISSDAQLLGATGRPDQELLDAKRILDEAVREGLDRDAARQKHEAFRNGFRQGQKLIRENDAKPGLWASVKRTAGQLIKRSNAPR